MADESRQEVARFAPARIPYHPAIQERFGVDQAGWRALIDAVWPAAKTGEAVVLALSYCKARKLDPFKRPVHIVGIYSRELRRVVESVWPGIGELRTTAFRTGLYAGREPTEWGPDRELSFDNATLVYPEWAQVTVHRLDRHGNPRPYPGPRVYWLESYATRAHDTIAPNEMWRRRIRGQLDKCAEAAALRAAFPEEIGNDYAAEEMEGQMVDHAPELPPTLPAAPPLRGNAALRSKLDEPPHAEPTGEERPADDDDPPQAEPRPSRGRGRPRLSQKEGKPYPELAELPQAEPEEAPGEVEEPEETGEDQQPIPHFDDLTVLVPFAADGNIQAWFGTARTRLREMQEAQLPPDRFVAYRKANYGALGRLKSELFSYWEQLDRIIASGEQPK